MFWTNVAIVVGVIAGFVGMWFGTRSRAGGEEAPGAAKRGRWGPIPSTTTVCSTLTVHEDDWGLDPAIVHESELDRVRAGVEADIEPAVYALAANLLVSELVAALVPKRVFDQVASREQGPVARSFALELSGGAILYGSVKRYRIDELFIWNRPLNPRAYPSSPALTDPDWSADSLRARRLALHKKLLIVDWAAPRIVSPVDVDWRLYWADEPSEGADGAT